MMIPTKSREHGQIAYALRLLDKNGNSYENSRKIRRGKDEKQVERKFLKGDRNETHTFTQSDNLGIFEGNVIIREH